MAGATMAIVACAPTPADTLESLRASVTRGAQAPDAGFLEALTPSSRAFVLNVARAGGWTGLRNRLLAALKAAKPSAADPAVLEGPGEGATLFLVRDGLSLRLDLALSGVAFRGLREAEYPTPW